MTKVDKLFPFPAYIATVPFTAEVPRDAVYPHLLFETKNKKYATWMNRTNENISLIQLLHHTPHQAEKHV